MRLCVVATGMDLLTGSPKALETDATAPKDRARARAQATDEAWEADPHSQSRHQVIVAEARSMQR